MRLCPPLLLTVLLVGCARHVDTSAEEKAIRSATDRFNEAIASHNDSAIGAIYTADATLMPPNEPAVVGTAKIREYWAGLWPLNAKLDIKPTRIHVSADGQHAIDMGSWTFEMPGAQGPVKDQGKYLVHWRKENGTWNVVEDIWNSDNPPMPAAPAASSSTPSKP